MAKRLIDVAKEYSKDKVRTTNITEEEKEVYLAWVKGEVSLTQIQKATGFTWPTVYSHGLSVMRSILIDELSKK